MKNAMVSEPKLFKGDNLAISKWKYTMCYINTLFHEV